MGACFFTVLRICWVVAGSVTGEVWAWRGIHSCTDKKKILTLTFPSCFFFFFFLAGMDGVTEHNERAFKGDELPLSAILDGWIKTLHFW